MGQVFLIFDVLVENGVFWPQRRILCKKSILQWISQFWKPGSRSKYEEFDDVAFSVRCRILTHSFLAVSSGPVRFGEPREACRNHLHLSWHLSDSVVPSRGRKISWGIQLSVYGRKSLAIPTVVVVHVDCFVPVSNLPATLQNHPP